MLTTTRKKALIPIREYYFSDHPAKSAPLELVTFFIQAKTPIHGFRPFTSRIIQLQQGTSQLAQALSKSTRYKIKRAERNGVSPVYDRSPDPSALRKFKAFFDAFARGKGIAHCSLSKLESLARQNALFISHALNPNGSPIVAHAYVVDQSIGRARLLYSASHFRSMGDTQQRNGIGMANRLLHWSDILFCKNEGLATYDLGGVSPNSQDPEKRAIARFKLEFGGTELTEFTGCISKSPLMQRLISTLQRSVA